MEIIRVATGFLLDVRRVHQRQSTSQNLDNFADNAAGNLRKADKCGFNLLDDSFARDDFMVLETNLEQPFA